MKETIEAFAVYRNGDIMNYFDFKEDAEADVFHHGGTVVRLTGEMPRVPRKREFIGWILNGILDNGCDNSIGFITYNSKEGLPKDCIKVRVTVEELGDE